MFQRSANRGNANNVWNVNTSGNVNNNNAYNGNYAAPDCIFMAALASMRAARAGEPEADARSQGPAADRPESGGDDGGAPRGGPPASVPAPWAMGPESVIGFEALHESMLKCCKGVMWKDSVASFWLNGAERVDKLARELAGGTYRPRPPKSFTITHPKRREIVSIAFRDRVYQRSLNDNVVYPCMVRGFVYDNAACQTGKGTDFARERLRCHLQRHFRKHGQKGYVLKVDVRGYYPNMRHDVAAERFRKDLPPWAFDMVARILEEQYPGEVGFNPGSQLIQIAGIAVLDPVDHFIKERLRVRGYVRYMDDLVMLFGTKDEARMALAAVTDRLAALGFEPHPKKTSIQPISEPLDFLGAVWRLGPTGKVTTQLRNSTVRHERRKLRKMARLVRQGRMTEGKLRECFESWLSYCKNYGSRRQVVGMTKFFENIRKELDHGNQG